jgi:hypothetical protein
MVQHPVTDYAVQLQNSIDALLHRGMDRFTLRALGILLICYDGKTE